MKRLTLIFALLFLYMSVFSFDLAPAEKHIAAGEYEAALDYLSGYESAALTVDPEERFKLFGLVEYYRALSYYKSGLFEESYLHLSEVMEDNDKKIGFNIVLGFSIIGLGEETQGVTFLKRASLLEGIRLNNSLSLDDGKYSLKKRGYYMIRSVNRIDPEKIIDYQFYHSFLMGSYKRIGRLSSLSVEIEKIIMYQMSKKIDLKDEFRDVEEHFKYLIDIYKRLNYFDSLSFVLEVYLNRYAEFLSDAEILKYNILSARMNFSSGNYIDAKRSFDKILISDLKSLNDEDVLEYYDVGLLLYYNFNIPSMIVELINGFVKSKIKNVPVETLKTFASYALEINERDIAYKLIKLISKKYPNDFRGYLLLADYYLRDGRETEALVLLEQVRTVPDKNFSAHYEFGKFLFDGSMKLFLSGEECSVMLKEAVQELEKAAKHVPPRNRNSSQIYASLGKSYFLSGLLLGNLLKIPGQATLGRRDDFMKKAVAAFKSALRYADDDIEAYEFKGWANIYLRHYDAAFDDFKEILKIDPFSGEATLMIKYIKSVARGER